MEQKTEWHDGLEFEVPTWDPTPVPWNSSGSWVKDPVVTSRVLAGIEAAVPNWRELANSAFHYKPPNWKPRCEMFWGSHGCDRKLGHEGLCVCGASGDCCSAGLKYGSGDTFILFWGEEDGFRLSYHHWTWFVLGSKRGEIRFNN